MSAAIVIDSEGVEHDALDYVLAQGGDAPGSVYGTRCEHWAPAAVALYDLYCEPSIDALESAISAVVNAHEPIDGLDEELVA